jgi:prolyl oligopeptidase
LPEYCSLLNIEESNSNQLILKLASDLVASHKVTWDLLNSKIIEIDSLESNMKSNANTTIETKFLEIKSFDGTLIPIRLVYKKGIDLKNVPVYMESYGGFNNESYLSATFNQFNLDFINHSGLYIGTGIRGGGEFDEKWHQAGALKNKIKSYEDLASIAKWLIDEGISSKSKIVSAGSSNGGLTVAATGLLYPQYFGLIIPHNGVLDMLGRDDLDRPFNGWNYEYGDSCTPNFYDYIKSYSPLENIKNLENGPRFLIINGRNDTRVNPAHSIKFAFAANEIPNSQVELISLNNSGHFNVKLLYNDLIAWRAQVVKWTTIYDFLGIKF